MQDAAYGTLLREPRRALRACIAETLENQFAEIVENRPRGFTAAEKTELWDRWQRGESLKAIGRAFSKPSSSIYFQLENAERPMADHPLQAGENGALS